MLSQRRHVSDLGNDLACIIDIDADPKVEAYFFKINEQGKSCRAVLAASGAKAIKYGLLAGGAAPSKSAHAAMIYEQQRPWVSSSGRSRRKS